MGGALIDRTMRADDEAAAKKYAQELREMNNVAPLGAVQLTVLAMVRKWASLVGVANVPRNAEQIVTRLESEAGVDTYAHIRRCTAADLVEMCGMKKWDAVLLKEFFGSTMRSGRRDHAATPFLHSFYHFPFKLTSRTHVLDRSCPETPDHSQPSPRPHT